MASVLRLQVADPDSVKLEGEIDFHSVIAARAEGERLLREGEGELCFDFAGVEQTNTAALSLLLCWTRCAKRCGRPLRFINLPVELHSMAAVSELEALLE